MRDGFVRVAAATCEIALADAMKNAPRIIDTMQRAAQAGAKLLVMPELCITGYTASDLFLQGVLRDGAIEALDTIVRASEGLDILCVVGLPLSVSGRLYNCACVFKDGAILGVVPKRNPPNYGEFYELRHFTPGEARVVEIDLLGKKAPFGGNLLFVCENMPEFQVGVEVCEDLWVPCTPGTGHALAGATIIANPSASNETVGKAAYRRLLIASQSARLLCGYVYADAGRGESTTDMVFAGHNLIGENGAILAESTPYRCDLTMSEIDVRYLASERLRMNTFGAQPDTHTRVGFSVRMDDLRLSRAIDPEPFVPHDEAERLRRCEEILNIQVEGLRARLHHIGCKCAVVGVSGGLDSTLAMLVAARAIEALGLPKHSLMAVTMPCFGTTDRTYNNAVRLAQCLGAQLREINISKSVLAHFADIGQDVDKHDVTYENSQARERTQVLMDLANQRGGIVVGTGDLSELALGWATYNGDHMSMYGVNASVPKTLVRHLVRNIAATTQDAQLREVLEDVLDTPVSPELLPPVDGVIAQRTEEVVGPYLLHDFFLYHLLRRMDLPAKIRRLAYAAFEGQFDAETIDKWLSTFLRRFFSQQFKRSCVPDGPKVGSVALSPRGDLRLPSDASCMLWIKNLQ